MIGAARIALVLGAEGEGMRHNTMQHCDQLARLPISPRIESLNVSNAAAIALYAVRMFALTGFYHRYFSHRTFRAPRAVQFAFAYLSTALPPLAAAVRLSGALNGSNRRR